MSNDEKERELQKRIFESPSLLPGFDGPAAGTKEVPVRRAGSADVVVVNAEGKIAIVECKRATNPECRRWVIGQVFEYAAGL
jgi:RecB family endonuclease NucS